MFKKPAFLLAGLPLLLIACSSGDGKVFDEATVLRKGEPEPVLVSTELVQGENRFPFAVINANGAPLVDAKIDVTFYNLNGGKEVKKETVNAVSQVPARDAALDEQIIHTHLDGSRHLHINAGDQIGLYTAMVNFDQPGVWGIEMKVESDKLLMTNDNKEQVADSDKKVTLIARFDVLEKGTIPNVGDKAAASDNLTAADVTDITLVDTSATPSAELHELSIADAVASGKPTVVLFAAPGYCSSQICGPEFEIMKKLAKQYQPKSVNFVHVEFYNNPASPTRTPVQAAVEWKLRTEPWFFVIDSKGIITARFEGPTGLAELERAIKAVAP